MPQNSKTPPIGGGASRDSFAGLSLSLPTVHALQVQTLIAAHHVRPDLAVMLAALAFGGQAQ